MPVKDCPAVGHHNQHQRPPIIIKEVGTNWHVIMANNLPHLEVKKNEGKQKRPLSGFSNSWWVTACITKGRVCGIEKSGSHKNLMRQKSGDWKVVKPETEVNENWQKTKKNKEREIAEIRNCGVKRAGENGWERGRVEQSGAEWERKWGGGWCGFGKRLQIRHCVCET